MIMLESVERSMRFTGYCTRLGVSVVLMFLCGTEEREREMVQTREFDVIRSKHECINF